MHNTPSSSINYIQIYIGILWSGVPYEIVYNNSSNIYHMHKFMQIIHMYNNTPEIKVYKTKTLDVVSAI